MQRQIQLVKDLFPAELHDRLLLVGGMVRDLLMGIPSQDLDLVAFLAPEQLLALGYRLVESKSTPNIYFRFHPQLGKIEITALPDRSALSQDLARRDFTLNAMAMSLTGELIDPLHGQEDLKQKALRACSPRSLPEDPGRIFRALRFECDGFRLAEETAAQIKAADWSGALARLPVERFSLEMLKALEKPEPARFFLRLLELGVGERIAPELFRMPTVPAGPPEHHPEGDLFRHAIEVLDRTARRSADPLVRFCGLFHDLGKLATDPELYPKHHGHEQAGAQAAGPFCRRLRLPAAYRKALQATCSLHGIANRWSELRPSTKVRLAEDAVKGGIAAFLPLVVRADFGEEMAGWDEALRIVTLNLEELGFEKGYFEKNEVPPEKRAQIIMQRRVHLLGGSRGGSEGD